MATTKNIIENRLSEAFGDASFSVVDESHKHKGHLADEILAKGSHFYVKVTSGDFKAKMPLVRHRMVYKLMHDLLRDNIIHALRLDLKTFEEDDV